MLGDILTYDPRDGQLYLYTRTARPEETDKKGKPLLPSSKPIKYRVAPPDEINTIIEQTYKSNSTGNMRGVQTIFKILEKQYLGISREAVRKVLLRIETFRTRLKPKPREIAPYKPETMPWQRLHADLLDMSNVSSKNSNYNWVLAVVDSFSKFIYTAALKNKSL